MESSPLGHQGTPPSFNLLPSVLGQECVARIGMQLSSRGSESVPSPGNRKGLPQLPLLLEQAVVPVLRSSPLVGVSLLLEQGEVPMLRSSPLVGVSLLPL